MSLDSVLTFTEALGAVGMSDRDGVYWAGRATLVHRPEETPIYDQAFAAFWEQRARINPSEPEPEPLRLTVAIDDDDDDGADDDSTEVGEEPDITLRVLPGRGAAPPRLRVVQP